MNAPDRVLVLDDDLDLRQMLGDFLRLKGLEPLLFGAGQLALEALDQHEIAVALVDLRLEDMSGLEALRAIRQRSPSTECILLTAHASQDSAIAAINLGVYSYFQKPFDAEQLLLTIRQAAQKRRSGQALRESEERFRSIFEASPIGIELFDADGLFVDANAADVELYGMPDLSSLKGFSLFDAVNLPPGARERLRAGQPVRYESTTDFDRIRRLGLFETGKTGLNYHDIQITPIVSDGRLTGYLVQILDITERKQAEEALRQAELKYRTLVEQMPAVTYTVARRGSERDGFVSPQIERMLGCTPEEWFTGQDFWISRLHPDDRERIVAKTERLYEHGEPFVDDYRYISRKGDAVWVHEETVAVVGEDGQSLFFHGVLTDISERKRAEEALRESEAKFRSIAEHVTDLIFVTDDRGVLAYVSPASSRLFGHEPDEMIGHHFGEFLDVSELARATAEFRGAVERGRPSSIMLRMKRKDGSLFSGELMATQHQQGGTLGTMGVIRDISDRLALQEQLLQAQKMEAVGRLAGGVAHDFNNMLTVILGHTETVMGALPPDDPLLQEMQDIQQAAERSADLTSQLLAYARKQTISPKVLDLNEAVESMLKMLRRLIGEDIELSWLAGQNLWTVKVDPAQVHQALANLAVNARDAISAGGRVTIKTANTTLDEAYCAEQPGCEPGEYVLLEVSDSGVGMSPEVREHLFEPFFTTKEVGKGTGLGLATVYGIVKQNQGHVSVESEVGKGSTFRLYLPRYKSEPVPVAALSQAAPSRGTETVLLVEDEVAVLNLGQRMLERQGYTVLAARTPAQALALAMEHDGAIHLLVTDVVMPGMNGRELAERLAFRQPGLRRLYMSGYTADAIAQHGVLDEGVRFLQKPFSLRDLATAVRAALDR